MALPETHLRQIARWCEGKVPQQARHRARVEHAVRGSNVTILERRAPWSDEAGPEWSKKPVAQLRYDGSVWTLYWPDRNARWQPLPDVAAQPSPGPLLGEIDDPRHPFWF